MGCTCSSKRLIRSEVNEPNMGKSEGKQSLSTTLVPNAGENSICHLNVLIWYPSLNMLEKIFPRSYFSYILPSGVTMTFTLIPFQTNHNKNLVIDCLAMIGESPVDKVSIIDLCKVFSEICIKIIISPGKVVTLDDKTVKTVENAEMFYTELISQNFNLEKILKDIFSDLDKDCDEAIDSSEMSQALNKLNYQMPMKEIEDYIAGIDLNHDGRINFYEFNYWWRRGRQGGKSLKIITDKWKNVIHEYVPNMIKYYRKSKIVKNKNKKSINIQIGQPADCKLGLNIFLGSSAKREEVLRQITNILNLHIYECWIAFQMKHKTEIAAKKSVFMVEEMISSVKASFLAGTVMGRDIVHSINHKVVSNSTDIFASVVFDICNEYVEESLDFLKKIDFVFKSPLDDFVDIKITCKHGIAELKNRKNLDLIKSIESGSILINSEHWAIFADLLQPTTTFEQLFKEFLTIGSDLSFQDPDSKGMKSLLYYLEMIAHPIRTICRGNTLARQAFQAFGNEIFPELDFYVRYNNFGLRFSISCEDLSQLFISD